MSVKDEFIKDLGPELGEQFHRIYVEYYLINKLFDYYCKLFTEENITLLNSTAPDFFSTTQRLFQEKILMSIIRLFDPPNGRNRNLSLPRIKTILKESDFLNNRLEQELDELFEKAPQTLDPIRLWRRKYYAHLDLESMSKPHQISFDMISNAVQLVNDIIKLASNAIRGGTLQHIILPKGGVTPLIDRLQRGQNDFESNLRDIDRQ